MLKRRDESPAATNENTVANDYTSVMPALQDFEWTTPFIADACVQLSLPLRIGPFGLRCNFPGTKAAGPARPARHAGSVDIFLEAIAAATRGDVLVIDNDGRTDEGCIGDLVVGEAHMSGIAGIICWGAHRDTAAIAAIGARVWSFGTCPNGPLQLRLRPQEALNSARLGSVLVGHDDYVFADEDGVVVVTTQDLERIVETAKDIASRESAQAARLLKGELLRAQFDLERYVATRNSNPSYTFREHLKGFGGAIEI
jgi:4-hydroxy-4-methyl-2-oxoglutarate aldolase